MDGTLPCWGWSRYIRLHINYYLRACYFLVIEWFLPALQFCALNFLWQYLSYLAIHLLPLLLQLIAGCTCGQRRSGAFRVGMWLFLLERWLNKVHPWVIIQHLTIIFIWRLIACRRGDNHLSQELILLGMYFATGAHVILLLNLSEFIAFAYFVK